MNILIDDKFFFPKEDNQITNEGIFIMNILKTLGKTTLITASIALSSISFAGQGEVFSSNVHGFDNAKDGRGKVGAPVVYVTSQGLYYDSIALADLPMRGNFQQLIPGPNGLETEFGPGDQGHLGGRWWIDVDEDGLQDDGDLFFLCPLLGPGRETL